MQNKIAVVYLMWLPYDIALFDNFLKSYSLNDCGVEHELIIVFNGYQNFDQIKPHLNILNLKYSLNPNYLTLSQGQDIDAYYFVASKLSHDIVLFLNTFSIILDRDWLKKYIINFKDNVGLISATSSNQSYFSSVFYNNKFLPDLNKGLLSNIRKCKLFLKAFFYWRFLFNSFPNPHVRTNGFMIRRELFISLKYKPLKSKFKAYQFESGKNSLTNQVFRKKYQVLVIDKNGQSYTKQNWNASNTFWRSNQENLLISDNQTRIYSNASDEEKLLLTKAAWGS